MATSVNVANAFYLVLAKSSWEKSEKVDYFAIYLFLLSSSSCVLVHILLMAMGIS